MVAFPDLIKTWVDKSDLVDFMTAAILNDDIMDEIIAVETAAIGHTRGGPIDLYMAVDPDFDQEINSGSSDMTYNAVNDRYECECVDDDGDIHGVYRVLPTPLQITPDPSAIIELQVEFTIDAGSLGGDEWRFMAGFRDFSIPATIGRDSLAMSLHFVGGGIDPDMSALIAGSSANVPVRISEVSVGTRARVYVGWQTHRPLTLTCSAYNATSGVSMAAESHTPITTSGAKDAALPHFGLWYWLASADPATIYVHDMFARVLRT